VLSAVYAKLVVVFVLMLSVFRLNVVVPNMNLERLSFTFYKKICDTLECSMLINVNVFEIGLGFKRKC